MRAAMKMATIGRGVGLLLVLLPAVALAQTTFEYNTQPRTFHVCRLLMGAGGDNYAHSLMFEGMRRFPDKPAGWELDNPLVLLANQPPLKHTAAYWTAPLLDANYDATQGFRVQSLRDMDLIYIKSPTLNLAGLGQEWREALIQAVHDGAVLWIDQDHTAGCTVTDFAPPGSMLNTAVPFTFTNASQTSGSYRRAYAGAYVFPPAGGPAGDITGNVADRLLQYPFKLAEWQDIQYLGMYPQGPNYGTSTTDPRPPNQAQSASPDVVNLIDSSLRRVVVVWDGSDFRPNIAAARSGAGAIVLTAGDVGYDVANWWSGAHRNRPLQHEAADCKFAWNVLALAQSFSERGGSSSNGSSSPIAAPPPLDIQWQYPDRFTVPSATTAPLGSIVAAPAVGRHMTFAISLAYPGGGGIPAREPWIMAFDNDPARDLDNDGYVDDGPRDYCLGASYDMVWDRDLCPSGWTPRWSSPTVATTRLASGESTEVVLVSLVRDGAPTTGLVRCFRADNGTVLWERTISAYRLQARVIDLSTPTVYGDWVFLAASEYDTGADNGSGAEDTYGRVHCFQLSQGGVANCPQWVFPSPDTNPNGDGDSTGGSPDNSVPEQQRYLPPFQDPNWVAAVAPYATRPTLPPFPTAKPTIIVPDPPGANAGTEVLLRCTSPISLRKSTDTAHPEEVDNDTTTGGSDWLLVPTPMDVAQTGTDLLNARYYRVWLPAATALGTTSLGATLTVRRVDDTNVTATISDLWQDPVDRKIYAYLQSGQAREYLLRSNTLNVHYLDLTQQGAAITIPYQVNGTNLNAVATLPPPVAQVVSSGGANERRVASATDRKGHSLYATDAIEDNSGTLTHNDLTTATVVTPAAGPYDSTGRLYSINNQTGETRWSVQPESLATFSENNQTVAPGGMAIEPSTDTAVAAITARINPTAGDMRVVKPMALAVNTQPRLVIQLRDGPADSQLRAGATLQIRTLNAGNTGITGANDIPSSAYRVDPATRTIEFDTGQAGWVNDVVGALWGKPVWVTYTRTDPADPGDPGSDTTVTNEVHLLPDIVRFQYMPYVIRLNHPMVRADANLTFNLPNGVPLTRTASALVGDSTSLAAAGLPNMPAGWTSVYPKALLDVSNLVMAGSELLRPGSEFIVSYEYLDPVLLTAQTAHERHQVPVNFGSSVSSPAMAGYNMQVGTEGYRPDGMRGANYLLMNPELYDPAGTPTPAQYDGTYRSFLSVVLDPITKAVRGSLVEPAIPAPGLVGTPVVSGPPALDGDGVIVGSRLMRRLSQVAASPAGYQGENVGYISRLRPQRTLVCDTTRLVEVQGQKLSWVCTGTMAPQYHEALDPTNLGNQELKVTPFSRPAKAIYLSNGNILVADTGNNRVVEIDRRGRQVWPLDENGYDYYTSTPALNPNLSLDRPSDCFRYYVEWRLGMPYASVNGSMGALGMYGGEWQAGQWEGTETHTVIADTGNCRVIDVVTTVTPLGVQTHRVDVLTPSRVRLAQGMMKLAYTRAIPVIAPLAGDTSRFVLGYICAASNLHQLVVVDGLTKQVDPPSNTLWGMTSMGMTWKWLAWLYDANVDDTDYAPTNPLIFRNIRDVQLTYEGGTAYLTVTCGQYAGRLNNIGTGLTPHWLGGQGAGIYEFAMDISDTTAPYDWARISPTDVAGGATVTADDPIWTFNNLNYTYGSFTYNYATRQLTAGTRRSLTNIAYRDVGETASDPVRWLELPWCPVSCQRLPADQRTVSVGAGTGRVARHLVTNYAELIQNLNRDNVNDLGAPAMLFSSVFVVTTDDVNDNAPENDVHEMDRREVIPDPHEPDWTDPINQPAYAARR